MRRIPAILLLGLFSFSLIEPAVLAEGDLRLPACCRREGLHHCAMTNAQAGQPSFQATCGAYPKTGAAPAYSKTVVAPTARVVFAGAVVHRAGSLRTEFLYRASYSRAHQERGPPILSIAKA